MLDIPFPLTLPFAAVLVSILFNSSNNIAACFALIQEDE